MKTSTPSALRAHAMAFNPAVKLPAVASSDPTPEVKKWYVNPRGFIVDATGAIITRMEGSEDKPHDSALIAAAPELQNACLAALALILDPDAESFDADRVEAILSAALAKSIPTLKR